MPLYRGTIPNGKNLPLTQFRHRDGEVDITEFDITESDVTFFQEIDITESDVTKKGN